MARYGSGVLTDHLVVAVNALELAPEALAGVRAAQEHLEQETARLAAVGDPTAPTAAALAGTAKAMHRLMVDVFLKTNQVIQEGRKPWTQAEMRLLINQLDATLLHRWTAFNRAGIAIGVAVSLAIGAACAFGGWWWRGDPPVLQCADQADGSRVCYTFVRPPTPKR